MRTVWILLYLVTTAALYAGVLPKEELKKARLQEMAKRSNDLFQIPENSAGKGRISDSIQVDVVYGYDGQNLKVKTEITDPDFYTYDENGNKQLIQLADGGDYDFDTIALEYKQINVKIFDMVFSYELKGNTLTPLEDVNTTLQTGALKKEEELLVKINQLMAGFGVPRYTNATLNHTANTQIIYRDAIFSGTYVRDGSSQDFEMNKNRYSFKRLTPRPNLVKFMSPGRRLWNYWRLDYERSIFPQVIYTLDANSGSDLNFVDPSFESKKFTYVVGQDKMYDNGFILGYSMGLGLSDIALSEYGIEEVQKAGVTNLDTSTVANFQFGFRFGMDKTYSFKYTTFAINLMYELDWFNEISTDKTAEENDNGLAELVYDREETYQSLRVNAKWSF